MQRVCDSNRKSPNSRIKMCPEVNRHIPPPSDVIQTKPFPVRGKLYINFLIHVHGIKLILNINSKCIVRSFVLKSLIKVTILILE